MIEEGIPLTPFIVNQLEDMGIDIPEYTAWVEQELDAMFDIQPPIRTLH